MPIHDWTKMLDGDFHDFHQSWIIEIRNSLNRGLLPDGFMAMSDQVTGGPIPDVVTLRTRTSRETGGLAIKPAPPTAKMVAKFERNTYAERADRIVIRHGRGENGEDLHGVQMKKSRTDPVTTSPLVSQAGRPV